MAHDGKTSNPSLASSWSIVEVQPYYKTWTPQFETIVITQATSASVFFPETHHKTKVLFFSCRIPRTHWFTSGSPHRWRNGSPTHGRNLRRDLAPSEERVINEKRVINGHQVPKPWKTPRLCNATMQRCLNFFKEKIDLRMMVWWLLWSWVMIDFGCGSWTWVLEMYTPHSITIEYHRYHYSSSGIHKFTRGFEEGSKLHFSEYRSCFSRLNRVFSTFEWPKFPIFVNAASLTLSFKPLTLQPWKTSNS